MELLQDFYETTLEALKDAKNDRLWFKTNTKLGKLYYDRGDFNKLAKILKQLHQSCQVCFLEIRCIYYFQLRWKQKDIIFEIKIKRSKSNPWETPVENLNTQEQLFFKTFWYFVFYR